MARTWYQLSAGVEPWADATSFSSSSSFSETGAGAFSFTNIGLKGFTSYRSGLYGLTLSSSSVSYSQTSTGGSTNSYSASGSTLGRSEISAGIYTYSNSFSQVSAGGYIYGGVQDGSASGSAIYTEAYLSSNKVTFGLTTFSQGASGTTVGTDLPTTSGSNLFTNAGTGFLQNGTAAITTSYTLASYTSGYNTTTTASYDSDYDSPSYIIVSTELTSSTNTATSSAASDTITYVSTTLDTTGYTYLAITNLTRAGSSYVGQTTSYIVGDQYKTPVIGAGSDQVLRMQTTTGSVGISGQDDVLGASFLQTTLNSAVFSGSSGTPYASTSTTNTVTYFQLAYGTITLTVSENTYITVTQQAFDGWIGGTETQENYAYGATTSTRTQLTGAIATSSRTNNGARGYTTHALLQLTSFFADTVSGINSVGGSAVYAVSKAYLVPEWVSFVDYTGVPGETVTTKRSPASPFGWEGGGVAGMSRLERAGGYQAPAHIGSTGDQGKSIGAASSFFIGAYNTGVGCPADIRTPFLTYGSTAETSDSVYSFNFGSTDCSVTASRTASSISSVGTVTNSYTTATVTSFTAVITLAGVANSFNAIELAAASIDGRTVAGGAHAWAGGQQHATLEGGYGWRYTIGNAAGTTSFKETRTLSVATAAMGSSILAAETFRAGLPSPALQAGLPSVIVFAYTAT